MNKRARTYLTNVMKEKTIKQNICMTKNLGYSSSNYDTMIKALIFCWIFILHFKALLVNSFEIIITNFYFLIFVFFHYGKRTL